MFRLLMTACSLTAMVAGSSGVAEAAKTVRKKAAKVEYLRAAGSEAPPTPARPAKTPNKLR